MGLRSIVILERTPKPYSNYRVKATIVCVLAIASLGVEIGSPRRIFFKRFMSGPLHTPKPQTRRSETRQRLMGLQGLRFRDARCSWHFGVQIRTDPKTSTIGASIITLVNRAPKPCSNY